MKCSRERGANLLEAAFVLPLLVLLMLGIIELGHAFSVQQTLTNAAREGARRSVAPPPGPGSVLIGPEAVQTTICNYLNAGGIACTGAQAATVSICQSCPTASGALCAPPNSSCATGEGYYSGTLNGTAITYTQVDISYPYKFLYIPLGPTVTLKTQVVMRNEND